MPTVLSSMNIFHSTLFAGPSFNATADPGTILSVLFGSYTFSNLFPQSTTVSFGIAAITGLLVLFGVTFSIFTKSYTPVVIGITGFLIFPFIMDVAGMIYSNALTYHSNSLMLLITVVIAGFIVLAIITLLEMVINQPETSD
jgi:cytochrome c oxidase subunit IV